MAVAASKAKSIALRSITEYNWSFAELKRIETLWGPHGYHRYPAKFIPQLVRRIIDSYSVSGSLVAEEAHGFVSREQREQMEQTLDQLRRIARRGRKRWLALHFVTQSPQHLPAELFELANNKIIHQTTGPENLRVLKAAAGTVNEAIWDDVPSLGRGRAIIVSAQYPHPIIVQVRQAAAINAENSRSVRWQMSWGYLCAISMLFSSRRDCQHKRGVLCCYSSL